MTEPRIQYAQTSDGVSIAYAIAGSGRPLVGIPIPGFSHVELQWETFGIVWKPLAQAFRVVMYDSRGTGLSDRQVTDFSMEAMIRDLEAVVKQAVLGSFAIVAFIDGVPTAVSYAASHPDRVSHLIICDGWAKYSDYSESPAYQIESAVREKDWVLYTETFAQVFWGLEDPDLTRQTAEFMRTCVDPEAWRAAQAALEGYDVSALLPAVTAPTLVIHNRSNRWPPLQSGQRIAAGIPNARFASIDDPTLAPVPGLIKEFLGEGEEAAATVELPEGMAVILFADIVESTSLTEKLGDAAFRAKARELDTSLRAVIKDSGGTPVEGKLVGDGVLAVFTSARQAIECALRCNAASDSVGLQLHLGIHAGDVIREGNNVYGGAVNIAARIAGASAPGEVLVSDTVRGLARTSAGVAFDDRGEHALKGVADPQRLFAVRGGGA